VDVAVSVSVDRERLDLPDVRAEVEAYLRGDGDFPSGVLSVQVVPPSRLPPGLARNRRARERWVRYLRQFPLGRLRAMGREEYRGEENQELRRQRGWT
jgi:hypothetical protein